MSLELEQAQNEIAALQRRLTEYAAEVERLRGQVDQMRVAAQAYLVGPDRDEFDPVTGLACGCCGKNIAKDGAGHEDRCPVGIAIAVSSYPIADNKPDCYVDASDKSTLNALETCRQERDKLKEGAKEMAEALKAITILDCSCGNKEHTPICSCPSCHEENMRQDALSKARELGLLEKEE